MSTNQPTVAAAGTPLAPIRWGLTPRRVARWFVVMITLITVVSLAEQYVIHILGRADLEEYLIAFDVDAEANLPTWYQAFTLLGASLLLGLVAAHEKCPGGRYAGHWQALSVILCVLSIDELAQLHEHLGHLHEMWHTSGIFYFAWVIPGALAVVASLVVFLRFLAHLPPPIRTRFVIAGLVYFGGALGVEAISGWRAETMGMNNMTASVIATIEEDMEMIGVAMLVVALLRHMAEQGMSLLVSASEPARNGTGTEPRERDAA